MILKSPAKINLNLQIKGLREDGYHLLESVFIPVSIFDEISIFEAPESLSDEIDFIFPKLTRKLSHNTIEKTLNKMRELNPKLPFFKIAVKKNIPVGAGLGGGSSNAAVVLKYINEAYLNFRNEKLIDIAAHIGADVPFFIYQKAALITGIGEKIEFINNIEPFDLVICKPPFSVSTKDAYQWYDAQTPLTVRDKGVNCLICGVNLINDLEGPVIKKHPQIAGIKKALIECGAENSLMTGSGSAVFGVFKTTETAAKALELLKKKLSSKYSFYLAKSF